MNSVTRVMRKSTNRVIQTSFENDGKLNHQVIAKVEKHLMQLQQERKGKDAAYMYRINQLLEVVIMLLPAVSLRHLDVKRANEYLGKAKRSLAVELSVEC